MEERSRLRFQCWQGFAGHFTLCKIPCKGAGSLGNPPSVGALSPRSGGHSGSLPSSSSPYAAPLRSDAPGPRICDGVFHRLDVGRQLLELLRAPRELRLDGPEPDGDQQLAAPAGTGHRRARKVLPEAQEEHFDEGSLSQTVVGVERQSAARRLWLRCCARLDRAPGAAWRLLATFLHTAGGKRRQATEGSRLALPSLREAFVAEKLFQRS